MPTFRAHSSDVSRLLACFDLLRYGGDLLACPIGQRLIGRIALSGLEILVQRDPLQQSFRCRREASVSQYGSLPHVTFSQGLHGGRAFARDGSGRARPLRHAGAFGMVLQHHRDNRWTMRRRRAG